MRTLLAEKDQQWLDDVIVRIATKMEWVSEKNREKIPYTTVGGTYDDRAREDGGDINWWTNGFWGGMMWLLYHETKDERYKDIANVSEELLDRCFVEYEGLHHDVGFMWQPTSVANYKLTGNPVSRTRALHAAGLLAGRFNPAGAFIRAWNDHGGPDNRGWAIIDCLMNLPLLYWASTETNDPRFKQVATRHADTALEAFVRPDGSVHHIVEFDPEDGRFVRAYGGQGYEEGSSWTRGHSWAMYGFLMSYKATGKQAYLDAAKRISHYFMANIPDSGVIPVDFRQPPSPRREDDTAAAIASCALIEIAKAVGEHERASYLNAALKLLKTLDASRTDWSRESDAIVQNGSEAYHSRSHHHPIIYGDYYFMEAIFKLKGDDLYIW